MSRSADRREAAPWVLVAYRAPREPSTERVAVWRRIKRMGAVYIAQSTCVLPAELAPAGELDEMGQRLTSAGGSFQVMGVLGFDEETETQIRARFNAERDAEYREVVERAQALVAELDRETARDKLTFAEAEENEADLAKLRRWFAEVAQRDVFGAAGREEAEAGIADADLALQGFAERAAAREDRRVED